MAKKIFCKENLSKDKKVKSRMRTRAGDNAKNKSDKGGHSKDEFILKNIKVSIKISIIFL